MEKTYEEITYTHCMVSTVFVETTLHFKRETHSVVYLYVTSCLCDSIVLCDKCIIMWETSLVKGLAHQTSLNSQPGNECWISNNKYDYMEGRVAFLACGQYLRIIGPSCTNKVA